MDLPEFEPKFIKLQNKHPRESDDYHSSMFWEMAIPRLARHKMLGQDQKSVTDRYNVKCEEYYGDTVNNNYFMYCWDKTTSNYSFPGENFVGSDPDPVYSEVFAQYFNEQAQVRDEMNKCGVHVAEQVDVLMSLSKVYNNQLQLARRPLKNLPSRAAASINRAGSQSGVPKPNSQDRFPEWIPAEDYDAESPKVKRRMEKAVTKVLSEQVDRDWVMVKDNRDDDWVVVEREAR
ncbi:uncharacterized protein EAF01_007977 [Botrytis porri]|uniref:Uncharacterized protein n=1 Tax=Botrytis porri TaxID=87229 RepID=A0A4Z1KB60_9HELO|nr:uncharacterized protein EAF01_007977 [Botrytis porri]KAF7900675.1 hypothetical protein EAF01_007977 [Botrytis porri]TGO82616.1 hypothetical protein BPOR_0791g00030 [Botrytis porri]